MEINGSLWKYMPSYQAREREMKKEVEGCYYRQYKYFTDLI
jgi:hypothetical protein